MTIEINNREVLYQLAKDLVVQKMTFDEIRQQLLLKTQDEILVDEIISQLKSEKQNEQTKTGKVKIMIGALCLLAGFLFTVINFHNNQSFSFIMYGSSCIGFMMLFWGLYDIVG